MPTYILLSKLTEAGRKTVKKKPARTKEVNKEIEAMGGKVLAQYAVLGPTTTSAWSRRETRDDRADLDGARLAGDGRDHDPRGGQPLGQRPKYARLIRSSAESRALGPSSAIVPFSST